MFRYWEFEDEPFKEKLKTLSVKEIVRFFFEDETKAYRFARALIEVKKNNGSLKLKDCSKDLPVSTWKRYLDAGVRFGILKHEGDMYSFTDRFSRPLKNFSQYINEWISSGKEEDLDLIFPNALKGRSSTRGGRKKKETQSPQPSE
ncbi:MAG: hypothetical protein QXL16_01755 [Candidatus Micrarchaeaceae archaeon]